MMGQPVDESWHQIRYPCGCVMRLAVTWQSSLLDWGTREVMDYCPEHDERVGDLLSEARSDDE